MNEIRCDEPSYLIWKWHPAGTQPGANKQENAIRWGSSLRVKDGEVAVFVYKQKNGTMQDYIVGPFDQMIETANFPVLASIVGLAYGGGTPFRAEVYFINLARIIQVRFGVPFFDVYDPRIMDFGVPVAVRGTISFRITDYREFVKLHRLSNFNLDDFQKQIYTSQFHSGRDFRAGFQDFLPVQSERNCLPTDDTECHSQRVPSHGGCKDNSQARCVFCFQLPVVNNGQMPIISPLVR